MNRCQVRGIVDILIISSSHWIFLLKCLRQRRPKRLNHIRWRHRTPISTECYSTGTFSDERRVCCRQHVQTDRTWTERYHMWEMNVYGPNTETAPVSDSVQCIDVSSESKLAFAWAIEDQCMATANTPEYMSPWCNHKRLRGWQLSPALTRDVTCPPHLLDEPSATISWTMSVRPSQTMSCRPLTTIHTFPKYFDNAWILTSTSPLCKSFNIDIKSSLELILV